jgi:hypothetical protein
VASCADVVSFIVISPLGHVFRLIICA